MIPVERRRTTSHLWHGIAILLLVIAILVFAASSFRLDRWQEYFFAGGEPINTCQVSINGEAPTNIKIPHPKGIFASEHHKDKPINVRYVCDFKTTQTVSGVGYLHVGWVFGDHIEIQLDRGQKTIFRGPDKPAVLLNNQTSHTLVIDVSGSEHQRLGLTGLQPMVVAYGSSTNAKILGVDHALGLEASLMVMLPTLAVAIIVALALFLGLRGRVLEVAIVFFGLSVGRTALGYFDSIFQESLINSFLLQMPLSIASGFAFLLLIMEALRIKPQWIRFLMQVNLVVMLLLIGVFIIANQIEQIFASVYQSKRMMSIAWGGLLLPAILRSPRGGLKWLCFSASLFFSVILVFDAYFAITNTPVRLERYLDMIVPFLVAGIVFLSLAQTEKAYIKKAHDLRKKELENQRLSAVVSAVQMISHDVRKPFEIVSVGLTKLSGELATSVHSAFVGRLVNEIKKTKAFVEGMLSDITSLHREKPTRPGDINISDVIVEAIKTVGATSNCKRITFSYDLCDSQTVQGDHSKLIRVFINLIDNAVSAMAGSGNIVITSKKELNDQKAMLHISVKNYGSHIAFEDRLTVFDAFYTKGKKQGTGLGLAIVKKIIEDQEGTVTCLGGVEQSTDMTKEKDWVSFDLRLLTSSVECPATLQLIKAIGSKFHQKDVPTYPTSLLDNVSKGLLVEDNLFIQDLWRPLGILIFDNPREVLQSDIDFNQIDFIITDFYFGDGSQWDGTKFLRYLRESGFLGPIFLSSNVDLSDDDLAEFSGRIDKNPPTREALDSLLKGCLNKKNIS